MDHPWPTLTYRTDFCADSAAKAAFCDFARALFDLDLRRWDAAGCWDAEYHPFAFFDPHGRVVSTVCLYAMQLCVAGKPCAVGQLSTVATLPEWRRRGLARYLAQQALVWSEQQGHAFQYLFSDDEAVTLYRGLGFVPIQEQVTTIEVAGRDPMPGARPLKLEAADVQAFIHERLARRCPVSQRLGAWTERLAMFHVIGGRHTVVFVEPLDVVVVARRECGVLRLIDVIGRHMPALRELYPYIADAGDTRIVIRFEPDALGDLAAVGRVGTELLCGNNLHIRGVVPLTPPMVFPLTAQA